MEKTNIRYVTPADIDDALDFASVDVSFISQILIMPSAVGLLRESGFYISLIKPQFEVGKSKIGKGGIVKNADDRLFGVEKILECANRLNMKCVYFSKSPILGGDGNTEYLAIFSKNANEIIPMTDIKKIVLEK